jgi:hypothetical protein
MFYVQTAQHDCTFRSHNYIDFDRSRRICLRPSTVWRSLIKSHQMPFLVTSMTWVTFDERCLPETDLTAGNETDTAIC